MSKKEFEIIKFSYGEIELDIKVLPKENTVWLSIEDMTILFKKSRTTISKHIKNILHEKEVDEETIRANFAQVHQKFAHVQYEGDHKVTREIDYYNLEIIMEVGNRTNSEITSIFYNWCMDTLADLNGENEMKSNIIRYDEFDFYLDVNFVPEENIVYLNQNQIAILFGTTRQNVNMHIKNIDEEGELTIEATCKDFLLVQLEGDRKIERKIQCFNLDMVLAVGYRVKGSRAVAFRRWATKILTEYIRNGSVIDNNRVLSIEHTIDILEKEIFELKENQSNLENDFTDLKEKIFVEPIKERLFFQGDYFDAYEFICSLLKDAKKHVVVIDPYFDLSGLKFISKINRDVDVTICISKDSSLSKEDIDEFERQYFPIHIVKNNFFHDRFLFIDDIKGYTLGASFNRFGFKIFYTSEILTEGIISILTDIVIDSPIW